MPTILVVDDQPVNRQLLHAMLAEDGTTILEAASGEDAVEIAQRARPDLVLLDVMMPGLDGFETARRLKQQAGEVFLPVVLVTALADRESRVRGLEAGADEFLTKPVDRHELQLRVRNLLALRGKETTLSDRNVKMLELVRFRDEMSSLLVHDLKNPAAVVGLSLEFFRENGPRLDADCLSALEDARGANERILRIVENMLDLVRLESHRLVLHRAPTRPAQLLSAVAEGRARLARQRTVHVELEADRDLQVSADVDLITRVIENVLDNSLRYVPVGGNILMRAEGRGETATMLIANDGPPVPLEQRQAIFEKYGQGGPPSARTNLGLGLYFCKLAMEAHGGRIWVGDEPMPAAFALELPLAPRGPAWELPSLRH
jgi:signal transduction histidine kinase